MGDVSYESGPDGMFPAAFLPDSLKELGISLRRFKTGTPARVLRSSIDFSNLEVQRGDEPIVPFSYDTEEPLENKAVCHVSWTNDETKQVILENIHRSPLYGGQIEGIGPRYCPSIEDKVVRFPDKPRHQLFIEPCGLDTEEMYLQGMSSSLPEDVQVAFYHTIPGLEHAQILRTAYAIEYDCCDPLQLSATLEFRDWPGLYGAGQFNGSSGYEEAAAQGFVAGVNAARKVQGKAPFVLDRASSYIGTLIDDLITKGASDPYRMMTSRSEYRLVLRQDNADRRLTPIGYRLGLVPEERMQAVQEKYEAVDREIRRLEHTGIPGSEGLNRLLAERGSAPVTDGARLIDLLRRPQMTYRELMTFDSGAPALPEDVAEQVEISVKYEGYIRRQEKQVEELRQLEKHRLPPDMEYSHIQGLRLEAREKLAAVRPLDLGQASRISGVSPADIAALMIWLHTRTERGGRHMKMLDLTHCITPEMPVYPGTEPPRLTAACTMEKDGFRETLLEMYSHTGTHMDAPAHMLPNGRTLDDFPAETFAGRGFVLDCREAAEITLPMLRRQEKALGEAEFLLFCTGWDRYWGQPRYYEGFPCLTAEAAEYVASLGLKGVGEDSISLDPCDTTDYPNHMILLGAGLVNTENLTGLEALVGKTFTFLTLPLKWEHADGSSCRAMAMLREEETR